MTREGAERYQFPREESVVLNTVRAVSDFRDVPETDLAPLYEAVDPEALETLLNDSESSVDVTFRYEGLNVTVRSGIHIAITEPVVGV